MKMSKSVGNVVDPVRVIEGGSDKKKHPAYGADTLRLWVASVDYTSDVCIGDNILKTISEAYRKIRNTFRFMLGSVSDFDPAINSLRSEVMPEIDKYMLGRLSEVKREVELAFQNYHYYRVYQLLYQFSSVDLSAFYLDIVKDRLYISRKDDLRRRSAQTVICICLEQLAVMIAPLTPHMAEEIWQHAPYPKAVPSIFQKQWPKINYPAHDTEKWSRLMKLRNDVNKALEKARQDKLLGSSQDSMVFIYCGDVDFATVLREMSGHTEFVDSTDFSHLVDDLRFFFLTSEIKLVDSVDHVTSATKHYVLSGDAESDICVGVANANGKRCERCWFHSTNVGLDEKFPDVCQRCCAVL
jgi:isoleucyl-tRNA synthetase